MNWVKSPHNLPTLAISSRLLLSLGNQFLFVLVFERGQDGPQFTL